MSCALARYLEAQEHSAQPCTVTYREGSFQGVCEENHEVGGAEALLPRAKARFKTLLTAVNWLRASLAGADLWGVERGYLTQQVGQAKGDAPARPHSRAGARGDQFWGSP